MRLILSTGLLVIGMIPAFSQIGINNPFPDTSAILDLSVPSYNVRGFLLPKIEFTADTASIVDPTANGLSLFNEQTNEFIYFDKGDGEWYSSSKFKSRAGTNVTFTTDYVNIGSASTTTISGRRLHVTGNAEVTGDMHADKFFGEYTVPDFAILMYNGTTAPTGFVMCEGGWYNQLTGLMETGVPAFPAPWYLHRVPDLRGRFVVGRHPSDTDYDNVGERGPSFTDADGTSTGSNHNDAKQVRLTWAQSGLPPHNHNLNTTVTTSTDGAHSHTFQASNGTAGGMADRGGGGAVSNYSTTTAGAHSHTVTINANTSTVGTNNATDPIENRPPYYVISFIMKVPTP